MKKFTLACLALFSLLSVYSQSDDKNLQTRKVTGFHGVETSGGIDLYLKSGHESVAISAPESVRAHIKTEVVNGILSIGFEEGWHRGIGVGKIRAYVSIETLEKLGASGGSNIILENEITAKDVDIDLSGGSDLKGKMNANSLVINQSGGSGVDISGNVKTLKVESSGGSDLHGYDLVTDYVTISASGGSDSYFTANKEIRIVASGGSDVHYKGQATVKEVNSSGSSSITHKD